MSTVSLPKNASVVLGLGKTGLSCVRYLVLQKRAVVVMDTRPQPPELNALRAAFPNVPVYLGEFDSALLVHAHELIVSPGLSVHLPAIQHAKQHGIPVIGDIELFARAAHAPIVAITGSNAKGTVTTLLGDMAARAGLQVQVGGNIGTPALDLLLHAGTQLYVLELSSFQLETTYSLSTVAATILNVSPDHLDRYNDLAAYTAAKQRIYQQCDHPVYCREEAATYPAQPSEKTSSFGLTPPTDLSQWGLREQNAEQWLAHGDECLLPVNALRIQGRHNWLNALAALALGEVLALPMDSRLNALREFPGLPHRCQWVTTRKHVSWYNDSKGTNIGATIAAITGLGIERNLILIAGGVGKGADFSLLRPAVLRHVRHVILLGQDAPLIEQALGTEVPMVHAADLEAAVLVADTLAQAGDCVLLSPACASFDMFRDFEHRGDVYAQAVRSLPA